MNVYKLEMHIKQYKQ